MVFNITTVWNSITVCRAPRVFGFVVTASVISVAVTVTVLHIIYDSNTTCTAPTLFVLPVISV